MEIMDAEQLLSDPHLAPATLAEIAGQFPTVRAQVATHPSLYPQLREWLVALHDPNVDAALAGPPAPSAPLAPPAVKLPPAPPVAPSASTVRPTAAPVVSETPNASAPAPLPSIPPKTDSESGSVPWIMPVLASLGAIATVVLVILAIVMPSA